MQSGAGCRACALAAHFRGHQRKRQRLLHASCVFCRIVGCGVSGRNPGGRQEGKSRFLLLLEVLSVLVRRSPESRTGGSGCEATRCIQA